jgi:hypothetical protein
MALAKIDTFSDEEFMEIIKTSNSLQEVSIKLGYVAKSGSNYKRIHQRIDKLNLSIEHFVLGGKTPTKRTFENIFVENSTAD